MFSINGEEWDILAVSANHPKLMRSDGSRSVASCDDDTKTIYVDRTLQGAFLKKVLCHEITHAAMFSYNVDLSYVYTTSLTKPFSESKDFENYIDSVLSLNLNNLNKMKKANYAKYKEFGIQ